MYDELYTPIGGFLVFVFIVILTMSIFKGKHDQRVESLDFLKKLFGLGKEDPPNSTVGSSARNSTAGSSARNSTAGSSARNSTAGSSARNSTAGSSADYENCDLDQECKTGSICAGIFNNNMVPGQTSKVCVPSRSVPTWCGNWPDGISNTNTHAYDPTTQWCVPLPN
jgi:hypothetical protein